MAMSNEEKVECHLTTMVAVYRAEIHRLVNPPVERSYMTGEQRNDFYRTLLRNSKREIRRLKRVLHP